MDIYEESRQDIFEYLAQGFKPTTFMTTCTKYKNYFINYFEVIIAKDGTTYFAAPSHDTKMKELAKKDHKVDFRKAPYRYTNKIDVIMSKYNYISVHYDDIYVGAYLTPAQRRALKIYYKSGLISNTARVRYTYEYQRNSLIKNLTDDINYNNKMMQAFTDAINMKGESIKDALYGYQDYKTITVYREDNDEISYKYTKDMEPVIISENSNYFTVEYCYEINKLKKYEEYASYNLKTKSFEMKSIVTCDYMKSKYYYKIG